MTILKKFLQDDSGATLIEYALIGVVISISIVAVFPTLETSVQTAFNNIQTKLAAT